MPVTEIVAAGIVTGLVQILQLTFSLMRTAGMTPEEIQALLDEQYEMFKTKPANDLPDA